MFPDRVYTGEEVRLAKSLIDKGYRHRLQILGSPVFKAKTREAVKLVKTAGYFEFLRTYIRSIREVEGLSQLREAEASIWANIYTVEDAVDAAGFFVQKAYQMKAYVEGRIYYGHQGETESVDSRMTFLKTLRERSKDPRIREVCESRLKSWDESKFF
ncbi:MAG: hypothetical protein QXG97_03450 [Nitrososphaerota archaeon]